MHKKARCKCKVVVLPCQAISFFYFLVAAASYIKLSIIYAIVIGQKQNFSVHTELLLMITPETFFRLIGSSILRFWNVENERFPSTNELGNCGETIAVVYELTKRTQEKLFRRLGTIIQSIFLFPIKNQHSLDRWEMVR